MEVQVEYDYQAQEPDEISICKGDILTNVVQKSGGWWEGTLNGKRGLFPDNFCRVISNGPDRENDDNVFNETVQLRNKKTPSRKLKALFSYTPEQDDELGLEVGDVLEFVSEIEDGWFLGSLNGKRGIFPSNFVEDIAASETQNGTPKEPIKAPETIATNQKQSNEKNFNRATYIKPSSDVVPPEKTNSVSDDDPPPILPPKPDDELDLNEGDIITIVSKNCEDEGWWRGELAGRVGLFPDNFCKILSPNDPMIPSSLSTLPQQKMLAQGRNIAGIVGGDSSAGHSIKDSSSGVDASDGAAGSKGKLDIGNKKTTPSKRDSRGDLPTVPSPVSATNPGFTYGLPPSHSKLDRSASGGRKEPLLNKSEDGLTKGAHGDFNAVERSEKLNHLTAQRAKPPSKRRPPSAVLSRENEHDIANGVDDSIESSIDSPQYNTSLNHNGVSSFNSTASTPSTVLVSDSSSLSTPGIKPLQNHYRGEIDNNSTPSPTALNSIESSTPVTGNALPAKPKKLLPWMAELKQTQDKKRALATSPTSTSAATSIGTVTTSTNVSSSPLTSASNAPVTSPAFTSTPSLRPTPFKEKDTAAAGNLTTATKAPPLPAKPTMSSADKNSSSANANNISPIVPNPSATNNSNTTTTTSSTISTFSLKFGGIQRKTPTNAANNYINTALATNATPSPGSVVSNSNATTTNTSNNNGITPTQNSTSSSVDAFENQTSSGSKGTGNLSKPEFVPYEEFQKLKDRVYFLESELEATKKQLKLLLDRGHIV